MLPTRMGDASRDCGAEYEQEIGAEFNTKNGLTRTRMASRTSGCTEPVANPAIVFRAFTKESLNRKRSPTEIDRSRRASRRAKKLSSITTGQFLSQQSAKQQLQIQSRDQPDPYLASGQQLPSALARQLPDELLGKPIEEIDPYYEDKDTFVILSKSKELTRFSANSALGLFGPFHPIRRVVLYILVNPIFNLLVILTILINCILMTFQGSEEVEKTEIIFTIVYTTEMGLKVLARGFIMDRFTYLRDPWNWLDFAVIIMAYLTIVIEDLGNLSVMRTFRVLRALKTVAIIPGMKTIVGAVIDSVKNLKDVVVLSLFSLSVFSLLGLQIYMGQLTQKCILNGPSNMTDSEWFSWNKQSDHWVPDTESEIFGAYRLCGNASGAQSCPPRHTCLQGFGPNPDYGYTNFDTFGWALICSFRLMTQDYWEGLYMQVLKTAGSWHILFFIVSIFLGSIYLMNLILAIVAMSYNELQRRAEEEERAAAEDEAAFLESCRVMEEIQRQELEQQQKQQLAYHQYPHLFSATSPGYFGGPGTGGAIDDYDNNNGLDHLRRFSNLTNYSASSSSASGANSSYRPSLEIGLVGQSILASICQKGLLSHHLLGAQPAGFRSHSLSLNLYDQAGQRALATGTGRQARLSTSTLNPQDQHQRHRKQQHQSSHYDHHHHQQQQQYHPLTFAASMTELRRRSSVRNPLTGNGRGSPVIGGRATPPMIASSHQTSRQPECLSGGQAQLRPKYHVSSGAISGSQQTRQQHHQMTEFSKMNIGTDTASDRELNILKQRAAIIRIVSDDTEPDRRGRPDHLERPSALDTTQYSINQEDGDHEAPEEEEQDERRGVAHQSALNRAGSINLRRKSLSRQHSQRRRKLSQLSFGQRSLAAVPSDHTPHAILHHQPDSMPICRQPSSVLSPSSASYLSPRQEPIDLLVAAEAVRRLSSQSARLPVSIGRPGETIGAPIGASEEPSSSSQASARQQARKFRSNPSSPETKGAGPLIGAASHQHLAASGSPMDSSAMHHLSVENFQRFGLLQARCSTGSGQITGGQSSSWHEALPSLGSQGTLDEESGRHGRRRSSGRSRQLHVHLATSSEKAPSAGVVLSAREEADHNGADSELALRPRQSIIASSIAAVANRRVSREFRRRASNWSRLSVSNNVDMRMLLKLWSHTNPYQSPATRSGAERSSLGSFQYGPASLEGTPTPSVRNLGGGLDSVSGSRRPSSVSSARQAYELMAAFSRNRSRQHRPDLRYTSLLADDHAEDPSFGHRKFHEIISMDDDQLQQQHQQEADTISVNMRDKCLAYCLSCLDVICIWECCGCWLQLQKLIALLVFDPFTELFIILCILINTLFMALDSDDAHPDTREIFEQGNYFFTATFAVEASMKIMALSPKFYFREGWNVFDSIIVGLSLLELGLEGVYGLSVLRSFRLLRVFKLAKSWPTLNLLISIMGKAVGDLGNLTFVLAIIVFIFAVMGMQLFGNKYVAANFPDGQLPRWNFTDFMHSFMIVFRILCAEWIEPMWDCLLVGGWPCIPFFLIAVTVGNLVVLNLFLALLLASFGASNLSSPQADSVDTKKLRQAIARFSKLGRLIRRTIRRSIRGIARALGFKLRNSSRRDLNRAGPDGDQPLRSHIAAMSKLERIRNIELRTEELKSRIRRSPDHHYHLRQLAKSQHQQQLVEPASQAHLKPPEIARRGLNFQYKRRKLPWLASSMIPGEFDESEEQNNLHQQMPTIPIIVHEHSDPPDGSSVNRQQLIGANLCHNRIHDDATHEEPGEINCDQASIAEIYRQQHHQQRPAHQSTMARQFNFLTNHQMQPIMEDCKDAESISSSISASDSVSRLDDANINESEDQGQQQTNLSTLAQQMISSSVGQHRSVQLETCSGISDDVGVAKSHSVSSLKSLDSVSAKLVGPVSPEGQSASELMEAEPQCEDETALGQFKKPNMKGSIYLRAPKKQDMEEDEEKALQYIETYIEKCICIGIICLKWFLFRQYVRKIVEHRYFDQCILLLIVISSSTLALEDKHLNERPTLKRTLDILDSVFTIIFSLEMILKWLAFGIRRYFGNIWSWLDFVIVLVSFVNLMASIFGSGKIQALKTMRTLRAMRGLRPLRALQRFQGMRVVVNALIQAIPSIFNVLLVCLIFWLIFSIMGVQMFGGKFWRCLDPISHEVVGIEQAANKIECIERNLTWANPQINFDNVLNAYLALFQVATFKGWIDIMNSATDSRQRDDQPIREANIYMYFYFVFFVIFGSFFTLNLFIGVIIDNFNEQKKKTGGSLEIFMTDDQKKYYHAMKKMRNKKPVKAMTRPKFKLQAHMFDITTSKKFDMAIMIIIGLNMFVMALEHYGQSAEFSNVLENLNLIFILIFTLECLCKIFAMRHFYFREPWNIFDFIVVDLSILGVVMKEYVAKYFVSPTLLRVVRVVKVGRVLRLVKGAKGIRTLLFALAMSLPALFNICLLLFLVMFIYAIFGMSFFMNVRYRSGIDETFNFETFWSSIIVLFQMSTSAAWDMVLDPLMDEENDCQKPDPALEIEGTCGNKGVAIFYLISYVIVTFLIIINMYIAVILENYSQATEDVQEGLTDDDYEMYYEIWQKFDPNGTQYLPFEKLSEFVDALEDPLRIAKPNELALAALDITIYEGDQCYCVDILDALTKHFFALKGLDIQVNEHLQKVQSTLHETPFQKISSTYMLKRRHYCAKVIQNAWRNWRRRAVAHRRDRLASHQAIDET